MEHKIDKYLREASERERILEALAILEREHELLGNRLAQIGRSGRITREDEDEENNMGLARDNIRKIFPLIKKTIEYYKKLRWLR